jgi:hypothetical protein
MTRAKRKARVKFCAVGMGEGMLYDQTAFGGLSDLTETAESRNRKNSRDFPSVLPPAFLDCLSFRFQ